MKTQGFNVEAATDNTGSLINLDWVCPYCGSTNIDSLFTTNEVDMVNGIAMERECDDCGRIVTIECPEISSF